MAVLHFDVGDDWVRSSAIPAAWNDAFTLAAIIDYDDLAVFQSIFGTHSATQMGWEFFVHITLHNLRFYDDLSGNSTETSITFNMTDDYLVVLTRAAGAGVIPRFHVKNLTTGAAWAHDDGDFATAGNPRSVSGGYFKIGNFDNSPGTPGSADDDYAGDIALVGFWDGVTMSDGQVEALSTNRRTSDWYAHAAGTPTFLTELTSTSPTDIGTAGLTLAVTGATLTGTNPTGWTFDGTGDEGVEISWLRT